MKYLTRQLFESMDIVWVESPNFPQARIKGVYHNDERKLYEGKDLESLLVFGAVLARNNISGRYPSPLLSFGLPKQELFEGRQRFRGLQSGKVSEDGYLPVAEIWESVVDVHESGPPTVYTGQGDHIDAVLFSQPLPFDPEKELLFARSPNGKFALLEPLAIESLRETLIPVWYSLVQEEDVVRRYDATVENQYFLSDMQRRKKIIQDVLVQDVAGEMTLLIKEGRVRRQYSLAQEALEALDFETLRIATCSLPQLQKKERDAVVKKEEGVKYPYSLIYANPRQLQAENFHVVRYEYGSIHGYAVVHLLK